MYDLFLSRDFPSRTTHPTTRAVDSSKFQALWPISFILIFCHDFDGRAEEHMEVQQHLQAYFPEANWKVTLQQCHRVKNNPLHKRPAKQGFCFEFVFCGLQVQFCPNIKT